jgi:hypothetical protein
VGGRWGDGKDTMEGGPLQSQALGHICPSTKSAGKGILGFGARIPGFSSRGRCQL